MNFRFFSILTFFALIISMSACDNQENNQKNSSGQGGMSQQVIDVGFVEIKPVMIQRTNQLPGRVVSYQVAEIRPQVSGIIQSRLFKEGSYVEEGQQLYQIDPARYEADYEMATANLEDAEARKQNAQNLVNRYKTLIASNAVSQQEYDNALASLAQARAAVSLAEAEVKTAKINLDYTRVYAPISGYISPSSITKGALVTSQQAMPLATVRQLDPVYVDLSQSAAEVRDLQERLSASRLNKASQSEYEVSLYLRNAKKIYPHKGVLDATDVAVDVQTGSIRLRSVFDNPDTVLLPGMFVWASIKELGSSKQIVIPQKSVVIDAKGMKSVWVIDAENKAAKTPIRTGAAYGNNWIVLNGLETGDRLIVEGTMMLRPGDLVKPKPIDAGYDDMNTDVPPNSLKNQSPPPNEPKTNSEQSQQDSLKSSVVNGSENSMEGKTDHSGTNQHTIEKR
tara:strand:- start:2682 stop:4037 length:1356 start_codon:yes stop_codon:yes gene_type:complete